MLRCTERDWTPSFFGTSGRSKYIPAGDIPCFKRAAPENSVLLSVGSDAATSIYQGRLILAELRRKRRILYRFPEVILCDGIFQLHLGRSVKNSDRLLGMKMVLHC